MANQSNYVLNAFAPTDSIDAPAEMPKISAAVDISGSMSGGRTVTLCRVLNEVTKQVPLENLIGWCDRVAYTAKNVTVTTQGDLYSNGTNLNQRLSAQGGTNPNCFLTPALEKYLDGNVFLMSTDGEIETSEMNQFSKSFARTYPMVICVLVGDDGAAPSSLNMSVVASFLSSPYVCVFVSPSFTKLVSSNQTAFATVEKLPPRIADLPDITFQAILETRMGKMLPCPEGFSLIGDKYVNLKNLTALNLDDLALLDMNALALRLKTMGTLAGLRNHLKTLQNNLIAVPASEDQVVSASAETQLMEKIASLENSPENAAQLQSLRNELRTLYMKRHSQAYAERKSKTHEHRDIGRKINEWMVILSEVESAGFNAEDMARVASNRINRLGKSTDPGFPLDMTGAHTGHCQICFGDSCPLALMLLEKVGSADSNHKKSAEEVCVNDFFVTFPLAFDRLLICPNLVCTDCADSLCDNKRDPFTREKILGYVPLVNLQQGSNLKVVAHMLNTMIGAGRKCYHTFKVLYGACEAIGVTGWGSKPEMNAAREFLEDQLLVATKDRLGMDENGPVVSLRDAFLSLLQNNFEEKLLRQPFFAAMVVLTTDQRLTANSAGQFDSRTRYLARKAFIRMLVEKWNGYLKSPDGRSTKRKIRNDLFECPHGVPVLNKARLTSLDTSAAVADLMDNFKYVVYLLKRLSPNDVLINDELVTSILTTISTLGVHERLETQLDLLLGKNPLFVQIYKEGVIPPKDEVLPAVKESLLPNARYIDDVHSHGPPPFVTPASPSKVFCSCGYRFGGDSTDPEVIKTDRQKHFTEIYGAYYPTTNTAHFNLHAVVRHVLNKHPEATAPTRALVIEALADLYSRKKGNIYIESLCQEVVTVMKSLFEAKKRFPSIPLVCDGFDSIHSNENLTRTELEYLATHDKLPVHIPLEESELTVPLTYEELKTFHSL